MVYETYAYDPIGFFLGMLIITAIIYLLLWGKYSRRTTQYRKTLTDLYVAGRIRQVATKDSINLSDEYEMYKQFSKKHRMEDWDLDSTIEEELKEKIMEEEKIEMKKGK